MATNASTRPSRLRDPWQSVWLDFFGRELATSGELRHLMGEEGAKRRRVGEAA